MPMMGQQRGRSLLNQIVSQNRPLPAPRPQGQLVGTPRALPGLIPYGPQPQGLEQSTRFTGGNVPGGSLSLTHPEQQTPTFQEPQYAAPQQVQQPQQVSRLAPLLAALAATGLTAAPTGATAAMPSLAPAPPPPPPGELTPRTQIPVPPGYQGASAIAGPPRTAAPNSFPAGGLSGLLATLAQQGRKVNLSRAV